MNFKNSDFIEISALTVHIGSQIKEVFPFNNCLNFLNKTIVI